MLRCTLWLHLPFAWQLARFSRFFCHVVVSRIGFSRALISAFIQGRNQHVSSYSEPSMSALPKPKTQHTTFPQCHRFRSMQGLPARHRKGRGQLFFPLPPPQPQGCGCQPRFRRDVPQIRLFRLPAAPVRNRRRPERPHIKEKCSSGTAAQLFFPHAVFPVACPTCHRQLFIGEHVGSRPPHNSLRES